MLEWLFGFLVTLGLHAGAIMLKFRVVQPLASCFTHAETAYLLAEVGSDAIDGTNLLNHLA